MTGKTDHPEARLSHYVDKLLDRIMCEPCWFTAVDTGTIMVNSKPEARMRWEQRRRALGIKPAHLDWYVTQGPRFAQFELKIKGGVVSDHQKTTIQLLNERNIPAAVCWSVWDVYQFLVRNGFALHGNAEAIAVEITHRWEAAQDGVAIKRPAKKHRVYAAKPSASAVARGHRMTRMPL